MAPKQRTPNDIVDGSELEEALKPFAEKKQLGWDWEFDQYGKSRRSQGPDRDGLEFYLAILVVIFSFAPLGHPPLTILRQVWKNLHNRFDIMSAAAKGRCRRSDPVDQWAHDSADKLRLMTGHVIDLKRSQTAFLSPGLQKLVDMAQLHVPSGAAVVARVPSTAAVVAPAPSVAAVAPPQGRSLAHRTSNTASESSIIFCGAFCKCTDCRAAEPPVAVSDSASEHSSTSMAALKNTSHVQADRGGHKRQVEKATAEAEASASASHDAPAAATKAKRRRNGKSADETIAPKDLPAAASSMQLSRVAPEPPVLPSQPQDLRVSIQKRDSKNRKERIVIVNGMFLVQCALTQSDNYIKIIEKIKTELEQGRLDNDREKAKARVKELVSAG